MVSMCQCKECIRSACSIRDDNENKDLEVRLIILCFERINDFLINKNKNFTGFLHFFLLIEIKIGYHKF